MRLSDIEYHNVNANANWNITPESLRLYKEHLRRHREKVSKWPKILRWLHSLACVECGKK